MGIIYKIIKFRRKYACKFGRIEHNAGRLLGLTIFLSGIFLTIRLMYGYTCLDADFWLIMSSFVIWVVYFCSHTLEKKLYGKFGFR